MLVTKFQASESNGSEAGYYYVYFSMYFRSSNLGPKDSLGRGHVGGGRGRLGNATY